MSALLTRQSAIISDCGLYRYRLERELLGVGRAYDAGGAAYATGGTAAFIMVNPSTADAETDDATIRKVKGFASRLGAARIIVGNKFAFRATDIKALRHCAAPVGPENDAHLEQIMRDADMHIVAWGPLGKLPPGRLRARWRAVAEIARKVGCTLQCLGTAQDGHPRHPLMLGYSATLAPWEPRS